MQISFKDNTEIASVRNITLRSNRKLMRTNTTTEQRQQTNRGQKSANDTKTLEFQCKTNQSQRKQPADTKTVSKQFNNTACSSVSLFPISIAKHTNRNMNRAKASIHNVHNRTSTNSDSSLVKRSSGPSQLREE